MKWKHTGQFCAKTSDVIWVRQETFKLDVEDAKVATTVSSRSSLELKIHSYWHFSADKTIRKLNVDFMTDNYDNYFVSQSSGYQTRVIHH